MCWCCKNILVSSTIGRNKSLVDGNVISSIINGTEELLSELREFGVSIHSTNGETADVGDLVRTIIVDSTVVARMKEMMLSAIIIFKMETSLLGCHHQDKLHMKKNIMEGWVVMD